MNAFIGMRITEWEDGEVNIGIAVCPTKRKSAPVIGCYWTRDTQLSNPNINHENYTLPKSAFIMRPATKSRRNRNKSEDGDEESTAGRSDNGFNITYAYQPQGGISDLGIMLTSTSSSTQDQEQEEGQSENFADSDGRNRSTGMKVLEPEVVREEEVLPESENSTLELEEVKKRLEDESFEEKIRSERSASAEQEAEQNLTMPHDKAETQVKVEKENKEEEENKAPEEKVTSGLGKLGAGSNNPSGMKRVSWVEDIEKFAEEKVAHNNSKENKRESGRKSNGSSGGGKGGTRSPTKKQQQKSHGFNSDDTNYYKEGYKVGKRNRNSGDKSRIPVIAGGSGGGSGGGDYHPTSCEFYRRQMLRECCLHEDSASPPTLADNWYGYTSLQRYAGQKVVKKFAAEQKRLEDNISNRRKTEIWILGSDLDDFVIASPSMPIRKKTTRLQPIQIQ